jgi:hypothetical protein
MSESEVPMDQLYFTETAWAEIRRAFSCKKDGRRAQAQQHLMEARFYAAKIHPKFIDKELEQNIDMASRTFF